MEPSYQHHMILGVERHSPAHYRGRLSKGSFRCYKSSTAGAVQQVHHEYDLRSRDQSEPADCFRDIKRQIASAGRMPFNFLAVLKARGPNRQQTDTSSAPASGSDSRVTLLILWKTTTRGRELAIAALTVKGNILVAMQCVVYTQYECRRGLWWRSRLPSKGT